MRFQIQMWGKGAKRLVDSLTATLYMAYNHITVHSLPHDTFIELVMCHQRVLCSMPYHCRSWAQIYLYLEGYYFSARQKKRRGGDLCERSAGRVTSGHGGPLARNSGMTPALPPSMATTMQGT
jgi:hypothetical protein